MSLAGRQAPPCTCMIGHRPAPDCPRHAPGGFDWPCSRRVAHKPHRIPIATPTFAEPDQVSPGPPCPGVGAHPATMIGRAS